MKITHKTFGSTVTEFDGVREAVEHSLTPDAYSYEGELGRMHVEIEKLQDMLAALIKHSRLNADELSDILGYGYEVEG